MCGLDFRSQRRKAVLVLCPANNFHNMFRPLDGTATRRKYVHVGSVAASMPQHGRLSPPTDEGHSQVCRGTLNWNV
jgi:hypothetical protein